MGKLVAFPWPGNVRQLENEVRRALVLSDGVIDVAELSADVVRGGPRAARGAGLDLRSRVDALEVGARATRRSARRAATRPAPRSSSGLSRFGLQKMMKRLKIRTPAV